MGAGDLIGVRSDCFVGCGAVSVEFSLDNGPSLTVSAPTVETHSLGKNAGYWFQLPSGMSVGTHEIRARIIPSLAGMERVLQGGMGGSWGGPLELHSSSIHLTVNPQDYYAVVASGGSATGTTGVRRVSVDGGVVAAAPPAYATLHAATTAIATAMGLGNGITHGAIVYLRSGDWSAQTSEAAYNDFWLTVTRHPSDAITDVRISVGATDASSVYTNWVKFEEIKVVLTSSLAICYLTNSVKGIWFDNCTIEGPGQTVVSGALITNNTGKYAWATRCAFSGVRGFSSKANFGFYLNNTITNCTSDIFTGAGMVIGNVVRNHKSLQGIPWFATDEEDGEHGDSFQNLGGISNFLFCENDMEANRETGDNAGTSIFQVEGTAHATDCLIENNRWSGFEPGNAVLSFCGTNPTGVLMRNLTSNTPFEPDSRNGSATFDSCELVNCVFDSMAATFGNYIYTQLTANGVYEGNHNLTGTRADPSDTTGAAGWDVDQVPTAGGNLAGRTTRLLRDARGRRRSTTTTAGAYAASDEWAPRPVFSLPNGAILESGRTVSISSEDGYIRFTSDGATPTESSDLYLAPITPSAGATYQAVTIYEGFTSPIASATYQIITNNTPAPPRIGES
jgi:hypothetical protein